MRCLCRSSFASSIATPSCTVTRFFVITSPTWSVEPLLEADVAVGEDADRALVRVDDRQAADPVAAHDRERLVERPRRRDRDRVDDDARLRLLDAADLARLLLDRQVLVDEADAALARHADRGRGLGDGVHRRADAAACAAGSIGVSRVRHVDVARDDLAVRRDEQDVVEGERLSKRFLEHAAPYSRGMTATRRSGGSRPHPWGADPRCAPPATQRYNDAAGGMFVDCTLVAGSEGTHAHAPLA